MLKLRKNKGITLIALVITIVVLVILASVAMSIALREDGVISKARYAQEESKKQAALEAIKLKMMDCQVESYGDNGSLPTLAYLAAYLERDKETKGDIEYVELASKAMATLDSTPYVGWENIYTKLKGHPYELVIDSSFRVAVGGSAPQEVIPDGYMKIPSNDAIIEITENGTNIDVLNYKYANVNVQGQGGSSTDKIKQNITISNITGTGFKINVSSLDANNSKNLYYYVNDELVYEGTNSSYTVTGLDENQNYSVIVYADKNDMTVSTSEGDSIKSWLAIIGNTENYTLNEVLSNSSLMNSLLNSTEAKKYLAKSYTTIYPAVLNTSYASQVYSNVIPAMTSATAPSGTVSTNASTSTYSPYKAFTGVVPNASAGTNCWHTYEDNKYLQYEWPGMVTINKIEFYRSYYVEYTIQYKNASDEWVTLGTVSADQKSGGFAFCTFNFPSVVSAKAIRFVVVDKLWAGQGCSMGDVKAYGIKQY